MPCEIGLSDGTKIPGRGTAKDFTDSLERMAHDEESARVPPYGEWIKEGDSDVWFNPAHVVYVKDVEAQMPQFRAVPQRR